MENLWLASMVHEMGNQLILEKEKDKSVVTVSVAGHGARFISPEAENKSNKASTVTTVTH